MTTIVVVTSDDGLHMRLTRALRTCGEIARREPGDVLPRSLDGSASLLVLDGRAQERASILADLSCYRLDVSPQARSVAIATRSGATGIEVVKTLGYEAMEAIFPEIESVEDMIRAHVSDPTRSAAAAIALEQLVRTLPEPTHETVRVVLGDAFRVSSVKQLATHHDMDRTSIGRALHRQTDWTLNEVIHAAKASYAVMVLRETALTHAAVAKAVGFDKHGSLDDLLQRVFKMSAHEIQNKDRSQSARAWLELQLIAAIERRGGGGGA